MQIRPDQLEAHLDKIKNQPSIHSPQVGIGGNFYFLWGEEALLIQESADKIRTLAFEQGFTERLLFTLESESSFEWDNFTQACTSHSLFSTKKIVEIILHSTKLSEPPFIFTSDPNILLLIRAGSLTPAVKKSIWFKKIMGHPEAILISHDLLNKNQLINWIIKEVQLKGLKLSPEVMQAMSQKNEGNVLAAHQEINMLHFLYAQPDKVQLVDLNQYKEIMTLTCQSRFTVFNLQNVLLKGESERALQILSSLKRSEFILILWVISKTVRILIQLHHKMNQDITLPQALQELSIWSYSAPLYTGAVKRLSLPLLTKALQDIQQMDVDVKTGKASEAWRSLLNLCLTLTRG